MHLNALMASRDTLIAEIESVNYRLRDSEVRVVCVCVRVSPHDQEIAFSLEA